MKSNTTRGNGSPPGVGLLHPLVQVVQGRDQQVEVVDVECVDLVRGVVEERGEQRQVVVPLLG
jgi:hypothetical protein